MINDDRIISIYRLAFVVKGRFNYKLRNVPLWTSV